MPHMEHQVLEYSCWSLLLKIKDIVVIVFFGIPVVDCAHLIPFINVLPEVFNSIDQFIQGPVQSLVVWALCFVPNSSEYCSAIETTMRLVSEFVSLEDVRHPADALINPNRVTSIEDCLVLGRLLEEVEFTEKSIILVLLRVDLEGCVDRDSDPAVWPLLVVKLEQSSAFKRYHQDSEVEYLLNDHLVVFDVVVSSNLLEISIDNEQNEAYELIVQDVLEFLVFLEDYFDGLKILFEFNINLDVDFAVELVLIHYCFEL